MDEKVVGYWMQLEGLNFPLLHHSYRHTKQVEIYTFDLKLAPN